VKSRRDWIRKDIDVSGAEESYKTDPARVGLSNATGIYVRALDQDKPESVDIAQLNKESLLRWLRSRGGRNEWAENVVLILLGHSTTE